jgi:hypothetical protein
VYADQEICHRLYLALTTDERSPGHLAHPATPFDGPARRRHLVGFRAGVIPTLAIAGVWGLHSDLVIDVKWLEWC